jgi:cytochrome c-type biogenesis protein CcmF
MFGTIGEKISAYFWQETKYIAPWFNTWMVPGGLLLLLLMGVGPLIPWRKVTKKSLVKNFLVPSVVSTALIVWLYLADVYHLKTQVAKTYIPFNEAVEGSISWGKLFLEAELVGVYSLIGFWGVFFIFYTMLWEFYHGARVRSRSVKVPFMTAMAQLFGKNKRRYGGYLTHIGFAGLFLGFIGTGLKTERDLSFQEVGQSHILEDKQLTFKGIKFTQNREYREWFAEFELHQLNDNGSVGESLGMVRPSRRNYIGANVKMSRWTTEKDEVFMWRGNVYLALVSFNDKVQTAEVMAHFNPMLLWMWIGGGFLLLGVFVAIWPEEAKYQVFVAAQRSAGQAIDAQAGPLKPLNT